VNFVFKYSLVIFVVNITHWRSVEYFTVNTSDILFTTSQINLEQN